MSHRIELEGHMLYLIGDISDEISETLDERLTWTDATDFSNTRYFYSIEEQCAYAGCLPIVKQVLEEYEIPYEVHLPELDEHLGWEFMGTYRPLQEEAVNTVVEKRYGMLSAPPGIGKTCMMAAIMAKLGRPGLIVVQQGEPFNGAIRELENLTDIPVGKIKGKASKPVENGVNVMMINTFIAAVKAGNEDILQMVRDAEIVAIDELHNAGADSYLTFFEYLDNAKAVFGVSATPFRNDDRGEILSAMLGEPIHTITYGDAIEAGVLNPFTAFVEEIPEIEYNLKMDTTWQRQKSYAKVRDDYIFNNPVRDEIIARAAKMFVDKGKTIGIIVGRKEHGENLQRLIKGSVCAYAGNKERKNIWKKLENREINVVITTLMEEATNIPSLDCVILTAGGKAKGRFIQRIRSTRTFEGTLSTGFYKKKRGYVYIPYDNAPFLRTHSNQILEHLEEYANTHPDNKIIMLGENN